MTRRIIIVEGNAPDPEATPPVEHLDESQMDRLTRAFRVWHDSAPSSYIRRVRGRYWLAFLLLRFSGARLGEILRLDDSTDIDFNHFEVHISGAVPAEARHSSRTIPVPGEVVLGVLGYLDEFPGMRGRVFALDQGNFRREFYRRAGEAEIPRQLSHPHILRHTRAIELLKAGVPLTIVGDILGHVLSSTTAIYLERTEVTISSILRDRGLL